MTYTSATEEKNEYLVANLKVTKIQRITLTPRSSETRRVVSEVTHLTIRAKDIETLRRKVSGHMDLIDDDVIADPEENTVTRG